MSTIHPNGHFPMNLPLLTGNKNYDNWVKQMKVVFLYQDMWGIVTEGVHVLGAHASEEDKESNKELKKRNYKALIIIHQCVDPDNFEKVGDCESSKEAWDILAQSFGGAEHVKEVKLQTYKRQFDLIQMEESETVNDYFTKVIKLVNQIKNCGEVIEAKFVVSKILRSLTPRFDHVVAAIETSKRISEISKEELLGTLESNEQRMNERAAGKAKAEVTLQAQPNKEKKNKGKWNGNKGKGGYNNNGAKNSQDESSNSQKFNNNHGNSRGGYNNRGRGGRGGYKGFDKSNIQCYNCQKYGHFADECYGEKKEPENNVRLAKQENEDVLLIEKNYKVKKQLVSGLPEIEIPKEVCEECVQSKQHRNSFSKDAKSKTKAILEVVYSDVCGPIQVESIGGNKYFVTFIDDFSRKLWTYLIKKKSDVLDVFIKYKSMVERQSGHKLKTLRTDGGDDFSRKLWTYLIKKKSDVLDVFIKYKSMVERQSGHKLKTLRTDGGERKNRTIMNMMRSMLNGKHLPKELWGEAVSTATYILNKCPTKKLEESHQKSADQLRRKLDDKSSQMVLVGYHSTGGYELLDPVTKQIVISRDVIVDELKEWDWNDSVKKSSHRVWLQECEVTSDNQVNDEGDIVHYAFLADTEPVSVIEALNNPKWINAMTEELDSIEKNDTWSLVDLSHGKKAIDVKWVFKVKVNTQDGLLITSGNEKETSDFKLELMREFEMTDLGHISYFLGIEFYKSSRGLLMRQRRYASEVLKSFEMDNCNYAVTPSEPRLQLSKNEEEVEVDPTQYRRLIGPLRYLCNTKPDLAYSVGIVSRFMQKPKLSHLAAVKRILRYIRDRKSTAGYVFLLGGAPIAWSSKKESVVALSSCEAEYIATSLCACQAIWLANLIEEVMGEDHGVVKMRIDNISAINLAQNPVAHGKSKHIEMRFHYPREQVSNGRICVEHCRSEDQLADIMTKAVQTEVFKRIRSMMGLNRLATMN
ncbi:hypothetical protein TSUD_183690 [Trifolium subterraneum]|uniref:CCHC-type domain-containing protein n=1 Tax=Trifolium subterraneum TaxID=3900 RepID=A0A2Z6MID4_TRISU|nr:hypothetical protein TSUD_183690 [Trifolium subterraneum]